MGERGKAVWLGCGMCAIALLLLLVGACADSHGGSNEGSGIKPQDSTETGNPPVIDVSRIALVVESDDVHVTGERGAVTPGGVELEVETQSSGDVTRATAARDGSFDVTVEGTIDDTYALRALGKGGAAMASAPVYLYRGGAMVGESDGSVLSCDQRADIIAEQFAQLEQSADRGCSSNSDCARATAPGNCPAWVCGGAPFSRMSQAELEGSIAAIGDGLCRSFERDQCWLGRGQPLCALPPAIACVEGQCVDCAVDDCSIARCDACSTPDVTWAVTGPVLGAAHVLTNCTTLLTIFTEGPQCMTDLACVGAVGDPVQWTAAHLQNALGAPEVQAALAADAIFGASEPVGPGIGITIGDRSIIIHDSRCGSASDCTDAPDALWQLRTVLEEIAFQQACPGTGAPGVVCEDPFDPGTGSLSLQAYAFNSMLGTCVPQLYTGGGGNSNRFDTFESCNAACPTIAVADGCASDREFVPDACIGCNPVDGCAAISDACVQRCTASSDCTDVLSSGCGSDGTCDLRGACL